MANSSSDGSCTAPADFQLSSELEDVSDRLSVNLLKCSLCHNSRRIFYCRQCIQNGDFVHSTSVYSERFADKQIRHLRLKAARAQLEEKCVKALERHKQKDKLQCDLNTSKERIKLLQLLVNETKQSINRDNQRLHVLNEVNSQLALRLPRHEERVEKINRYVVQLKGKQEKQKETVERKRQQLKKVIRIAAKQLIQYIFPLTQVEPSRSLCSSEEESSCTDCVTTALADASGTSYVRGRWINDTENSLEIHHRIVAPTLPGSGDYSAYSLWVAENKDAVPGNNKENSMHNPAYNISAALTYATQLVNIIAYYINVKLPFKLAYSEFCGSEMSDQKFARKVARLNSNVLHLCFTQNTDTTVLHPMQTLQNLMHLLNTEITDLGRIGPVEIDSIEMAQLNNQLIPDLEKSDDSASDEEEDAFNWEWEAVPNVACPEMVVPIPGSMASQQSSSMQVNQSVAGGLVTSAAASIASIWRGWTTNK
ncbi:beclin 1-associated autophagy-related key regulator isoform X1 [Leptopilina heterotoma]|uniref:beclin 1-associated autophagy-related key regulator isoform X1 n=1 Tax=Leptopilina heterotoma TaxID=63436 RepID=UPI001CA9E4C6|nr:beclin 1-associated autophagy-related key regulator isoform X1 [Leptopilina heterotoma]XP_043478017.1 beclin 1-associated autophagy-related key regulator isoform X1 [Leptopilina heterotoma]